MRRPPAHPAATPANGPLAETAPRGAARGRPDEHHANASQRQRQRGRQSSQPAVSQPPRNQQHGDRQPRRRASPTISPPDSAAVGGRINYDERQSHHRVALRSPARAIETPANAWWADRQRCGPDLTLDHRSPQTSSSTFNCDDPTEAGQGSRLRRWRRMRSRAERKALGEHMAGNALPRQQSTQSQQSDAIDHTGCPTSNVAASSSTAVGSIAARGKREQRRHPGRIRRRCDDDKRPPAAQAGAGLLQQGSQRQTGRGTA